jgi:hypothetical protein
MVNDIEFRATFREWSARIAPMLFDYRSELMQAGFPEPSADYLVSQFVEFMIDFVDDVVEE